MTRPLTLEQSTDAPVIRYEDRGHKYWIDEVRVPSVTQILDNVTAKDALTWWGMRVGFAAAIKLLQDGIMTWPVMAEEVYEEVLTGDADKSRGIWRGRGKARKLKTKIEYYALENNLTTNQIRDDAGDRGTAVHSAIETIGTHDVIPDITDYPVEFHGYIRAAARWFLNHEPVFHRQEIITGSRELAFAGRFDLDATLKGFGRCLVDFKTSKEVYDQHKEQLRFYDVAEQEMNQYVGEEHQITFDHLVAVHLRRDGEFEAITCDHIHPDTVVHAARLYHRRVANG